MTCVISINRNADIYINFNEDVLTLGLIGHWNEAYIFFRFKYIDSCLNDVMGDVALFTIDE